MVRTTTALSDPGVALPSTDVTTACMGSVTVLSAPIARVIVDPLPFNVPLLASDMAIATCVAVPLFL